jgi:hypothetical protein
MKYGFFAIQIISHKLLRWLMPFFLIGAFLSGIILAGNSAIYFFLFAAQLTFYSLAVMGLCSKKLEGRRFFKIPVFLTVVNASILVAWAKCLYGNRAVLWEPSKR